jgi:hypothetical protein
VYACTSQFGDIYQEDYFINYMKNDVRIVKELPQRLRSLDLEASGSQVPDESFSGTSMNDFTIHTASIAQFPLLALSQVTDMDISKEAEPSELVRSMLPILQQNGVVHFLGFGNRLGFDSIPVHLQVITIWFVLLQRLRFSMLCFLIMVGHLLQRLRCRCNFHALKFVPELQQAGSLLVQRLRRVSSMQTEMDKQLFGNNMLDPAFAESAGAPNRYLALHMRFEQDMVAYSLCEFGGGEEERRELQAYRETHFPTLAMRLRNTYVLSAFCFAHCDRFVFFFFVVSTFTALPVLQDGVAARAAQPGEMPADAGGGGPRPLRARLRPPDVHLRRRVADIRRGAAAAAPDAAVPEPGHQRGRPHRRRARSVQELLLTGKHQMLRPKFETEHTC